MTRRAGVALAGLVLALPFTVWWLVGDLSLPRDDPRDLDYLVGPLQLSRAEELGIGLLACIVAIVAGVSLTRAWRNDEVTRDAVGPMGVVLLAAAATGWAYRVVTAGVIGANIGGGLIMLAAPVVGVAALMSILRLRVLRRHAG